MKQHFRAKIIEFNKDDIIFECAEFVKVMQEKRLKELKCSFHFKGETLFLYPIKK